MSGSLINVSDEARKPRGRRQGAHSSPCCNWPELGQDWDRLVMLAVVVVDPVFAEARQPVLLRKPSWPKSRLQRCVQLWSSSLVDELQQSLIHQLKYPSMLLQLVQPCWDFQFMLVVNRGNVCFRWIQMWLAVLRESRSRSRALASGADERSTSYSLCTCDI